MILRHLFRVKLTIALWRNQLKEQAQAEVYTCAKKGAAEVACDKRWRDRWQGSEYHHWNTEVGIILVVKLALVLTVLSYPWTLL